MPSCDSRSQYVHIEGVLTFLGAAQYTNLASITHLTDTPTSGIAAPAAARLALIQAETQNVRWVGGPTAGLTLTASVGTLLSTQMDHLVYNASVDYSGNPAWGMPQFIGVAGGAVLNVQYFA